MRPRKPEMIIRENQPKELPPDVVRGNDSKYNKKVTIITLTRSNFYLFLIAPICLISLCRRILDLIIFLVCCYYLFCDTRLENNKDFFYVIGVCCDQKILKFSFKIVRI